MPSSAYLKRKYNLEVEQWLDLLDLCGRRCPLCNKKFTARRLACVDHDHLTGKIRGLLCSDCNWTVGMLHDNAAWMEAAARYLRYPPSENLWGADVPRVPDSPPERKTVDPS